MRVAFDRFALANDSNMHEDPKVDSNGFRTRDSISDENGNNFGRNFQYMAIQTALIGDSISGTVMKMS